MQEITENITYNARISFIAIKIFLSIMRKNKYKDAFRSSVLLSSSFPAVIKIEMTTFEHYLDCVLLLGMFSCICTLRGMLLIDLPRRSV